jgi:hypothetical protein
MPLQHAAETPEMPSMLVTLTVAAERILAELSGRERLTLAGIGWATVELARAQRELAEALGPDLVDGFGPAADDRIMGAYCRLGRLAGGLDLVLLEPNTEGRLAGALARWGEAVVVAYASASSWRRGARRTAGEPGASLAAPIAGPLGPARHLASGRRGPHLILVDRPTARPPGAGNHGMPRDTI